MQSVYRAYSGAAYLLFLVAFLYAVGFVGNIAVPKSIDAPTVDTPFAWLVDALLLGVFAIQHSVMARPGFKRRWTRIVPEPIERATYVLFSSLALIAVFAGWQPLPLPVWDLRGTAGGSVLTAVFVIGWLVVLLSTFMISHFELFGLTQAWRRARAQPLDASPFREVLFYRFVRHPIMLGFLIAFWATPFMSQGHLLFAALTTGYILVGVRLEERDLMQHIGRQYVHYRARVPALIPFVHRRAQR